jgi:tetratricopeptide (TPR) repeat protein
MLQITGDADTLLMELRLAGEHPDPAVLEKIKALGDMVVPLLIAMALDEQYYEADSEGLDVWAPGHAVRLLGALGAAEAVEPLLGLFSRDEDWLCEELPDCLGQLGAPALGPVREMLFDRTRQVNARTKAAAALVKIAQHHPTLRAGVVAALAARLDPAEAQTPDDETMNGHVISGLLDLQATEAMPAIERAFAEDHVDQRIVGLTEAQEELGLVASRPAPAWQERSAQGKGLQLWLRCAACGYVRRHDVGKVYVDQGTLEKRQTGEETPYSEFVIARAITCPKCGAVDQYDLAGEANLTLTAELLKMVASRKGSDLPGVDGEERIAFTRFTVADGQEMHPYAGLEMYRQQVAEHPADAGLRSRYANVLTFLGRRDGAREHYEAAAQADPANVEAHTNLGRLAREAGDNEEARRLFPHALDLLLTSTLPETEQEEYARYIAAALEEMTEEDLARLGVRRRAADSAVPPRQDAPAVVQPGPLPRQARRVGRNDPCPCGSGKKYKKCCGR